VSLASLREKLFVIKTDDAILVVSKTIFTLETERFYGPCGKREKEREREGGERDQDKEERERVKECERERERE
jgi:hypothetical protein